MSSRNGRKDGRADHIPAGGRFHSSPETTLGVELEIQILDPATGELVPGAQRILDVALARRGGHAPKVAGCAHRNSL
jgi:hypothetical protein